MKGITLEQISSRAPGEVAGKFTNFLGETYYRIGNYDAMPPFFMTIVSASDIWNYIWSNGGLTAGRKHCDQAVFPYYTADKVSDGRTYTGSFTAIQVKTQDGTYHWEPFSEAANGLWSIERNLYKNHSGSKVYFEEVNNDLGLTFQYGWTSSDAYGLVRHSRIINNSGTEQTVTVLDGCRNILPSCVTADFQNNNSVLLDAYKRTDLDEDSGMAIFSITSIVSDKAEPSEGLLANIGWFSCEGDITLSPDAPDDFRKGKALNRDIVLKGQRPAYLIKRILALSPRGGTDSWYQVFDTSLEAGKIAEIKRKLKNRSVVLKDLENDIQKGVEQLISYIATADGLQNTADTETCIHHEANVLFNIMRGGIFADREGLSVEDFRTFAAVRNKKAGADIAQLTKNLPSNVSFRKLEETIAASNNPQAIRLFREYLPITFSRRHGDPSRPWNRFSIEIKDEKGNPKLNYQGNWRDIFQNWEALSLSWPEYTQNIIAKFLNATTADGYNPYRITREGIDWEIQEPENPWSNIGYWGDHQIIYLAKLMELQHRINPAALASDLDSPLYSSGNVPYRLKSHADILQNPRSTIIFDYDLHEKIMAAEKSEGTDARLLHAKDGSVALVSMTTKILTLILAKMASFVPGGGIWLNTQRPEWNDANNALAGYGLSMVTLYYLRRFLSFLQMLYTESGTEQFNISEETAVFYREIAQYYQKARPESLFETKARRTCVDTIGLLFEKQRKALYNSGYSENLQPVSKDEILKGIAAFISHIDASIAKNRRNDGLYHAYNTMEVREDGGIEVHNLDVMLEGQVAVLSSGSLSDDEAVNLCESLKKSPLFREDQYSYILYPNKELPRFLAKNQVSPSDAEGILLLKTLLDQGDSSIIYKDAAGECHFNPGFRNNKDLDKALSELGKKNAAATEEIIVRDRNKIMELYEQTFHHRSFTGRSGTFYAYEGLGSIYWHMVSKLMLAVQENYMRAKGPAKEKLARIYYDVRKGIGFNKTPQVYGAFPTDPYSHTPAGQGAKQPGMTGQVKEEILTRWGELGVQIDEGRIRFVPELLRKSEIRADNTIEFSWCAIPVTYRFTKTEDGGQSTESEFVLGRAAKIILKMADSSQTIDGDALSPEYSSEVFRHTGTIKAIEVHIR